MVKVKLTYGMVFGTIDYSGAVPTCIELYLEVVGGGRVSGKKSQYIKTGQTYKFSLGFRESRLEKSFRLDELRRDGSAVITTTHHDSSSKGAETAVYKLNDTVFETDAIELSDEIISFTESIGR